MLVLSSDVVRNFLVLLARLDKKAFDNSSFVFEDDMSSRLADAFKTSPWTCRWRIRPAIIDEAGEIDLLFIDSNSKCVLVGEMKWFLPAGDAREVLNGLKEVKEKASQVNRKADIVRAKLEDLLRELGHPQNSVSGWKVFSAVVTEGFAGPGIDGVASASAVSFVRLCRTTSSLKQLCRLLLSNEWLPRRPRDFSYQRVTRKFGNRTLEWGGVSPTLDGLRRFGLGI
jgi:hypothetical protein